VTIFHRDQRDVDLLLVCQTLLLIHGRSSAFDFSKILSTASAHAEVKLLTATCISTAVDLLHANDISLVVLEANDSDLESKESCRQLRRNRVEPSVPILCIGGTDPTVELKANHHDRPISIEFLPNSSTLDSIQHRVAALLEVDAYRRRIHQVVCRLDQAHHYYQSIVDTVDEGIVVLSSEGAISYLNPAALAMLGGTLLDLMGKPFYKFFPVQGESHLVWQYTPFFHSWLTGTVQRIDEAFFRHDDGSCFPVSFRCAPTASKNDGVVVAFRDVSIRQQLEARLRLQAVLDPLTNLSNREGFKRELKEAVGRAQATGKAVALLSIDLDRFNRVNTTLGHETGDTVLQAVASRLQECVGESDMVARTGGDEFAIILADLSSVDQDTALADTILHALRRPFSMPEGLDITVSASIGIAGYPSSGNGVDYLMRCAEIAMYQAKTDGRGQVLVYSPDMNTRAAGRMAMEQALRVAVEERTFTLDYQPQIDLSSGNLVGFEALLRWKHDVIGNVPPSKFVPMLEETGLIVPVGQWVFEAGCQQRQQWATQLPDQCTISINLSPRQFTDKRLASQINHILEVNQLPPYRLEIELTESMLMLDREYTHGVLHALKDMGLKLSVDDFGTGYSSLAYLKTFALDALKIDKQFIDQLTTSPRDAAIATSIIQLAHNLGLEVVAEGVETLAQVKLLQELGCDVVQGYYFSPPMSVQQVAGFPHKMQMH
jgi:diguanylate cyclase (GGDEF)-like protein/PAS domain S-box-containing protein